MKKIVNIILIFTFALTIFISPVQRVKGKTLRDIKNAVEAAEKKLKDNQTSQTQTEAEMKEIQDRTYKNLVEADNIVKSINVLNDEIAEYDEKIDAKSEEIKKLLNFVQKTEGNNAYLEYIFGAEDFSDLIYRIAVAKQLSNYNNKLVDEYNKIIDEKEAAKKELEDKKVALEKKRDELEAEYSKLSQALRTIEDAEPTLEEDLEQQKKTYQFYLELGCDLDDDIDLCGRNLLPPTTALYRPLMSGYYSYGFGNRCYWLRGQQICDFHKGVDLGESGSAVPVYSAGAGLVVSTVVKPNQWSCGGQGVWIEHNVNGKIYTTTYLHLRQVFVKKGDHVTKDTVIGYMGGNPYIETYDSCTTGQHLHFGLTEGAFVSWSKTRANAINPASVINFPKLHTRWSDRITKY